MQIKVKNIIKTYNKNLPTQFNALNDVSSEFNQEEFTAIIGDTGSGKTTFIEHLNSLLIPEFGSIEYVFNKIDEKTQEKQSVNFIVKKKRFGKIKNIKDIRTRVGVVFQFAEYQLFESTIEKEIIFAPVSMGQKKEKAIANAEKYLNLVGLDNSFLNKSPLELSGGQKRRVAIASILSMESDILVLDEPTAGLDPEGVKDMMNIFINLHKSGKSIIFVTHDLDNVLKYSKRTIVFSKGKIIKDGNTADILEDEAFLQQNHMQAPKVIQFNNKLKARGIDLGRVISIETLTAKINDYLSKGKK